MTMTLPAGHTQRWPAALSPRAMQAQLAREGAIRLAAASFVAAVLLFAAVAKSAGVWSAITAAQRNAATLEMELAGMWARVAPDITIALGEAIVAIILIVFRKKWWMWAFIAALFAAYAAYAGSALARGAASCGCFGPISVPPAITFTLDTVSLLVAVALATTGALGRRGALGWTLSAMALAALAGGAYAQATAPPPSALENNAELERTFETLLALPEMRDVAREDPLGPAWLLFVYDIYCEHCAQFLPFMTERAKQWADDPLFRVRVISMQDAQEDAGIEQWRWPSTPTITLVERGVVVELLPWERVFDPIEIRERVLSR